MNDKAVEHSLFLFVTALHLPLAQSRCAATQPGALGEGQSIHMWQANRHSLPMQGSGAWNADEPKWTQMNKVRHPSVSQEFYLNSHIPMRKAWIIGKKKKTTNLWICSCCDSVPIFHGSLQQRYKTASWSSSVESPPLMTSKSASYLTLTRHSISPA